MSLIPISALANGTIFDTVASAGAPLLIPAINTPCQVFVHNTSTPASVKVDEFSGDDAPGILVSDQTGTVPGWIDPADLPLDISIALADGTRVLVLGPPPSSGLSESTADGKYIHQDLTGMPSLDILPGPAGDLSLNGHKAVSAADATADTDLLNRRTGDGRFTRGGSLTDSLGRSVLGQGTSSITAPSLRQFVFVDDAFFGAACDGQRVTDGSMTSGANTVSSTQAAFTTADVGKVVEVVGALAVTNGATTLSGSTLNPAGGVISTLSVAAVGGTGIVMPNGTPVVLKSGSNMQVWVAQNDVHAGDTAITVFPQTPNFGYASGSIVTGTDNLVGYVASVTTGVASLVTTHGGSTPINATVTVPATIVTYGTDDTAALNEIGSTVSQNGGGTVAYARGKPCVHAGATPYHNVTYQADASTPMYMISTSTSSIYHRQAFVHRPNFGIGLGERTCTVTAGNARLTNVSDFSNIVKGCYVGDVGAGVVNPGTHIDSLSRVLDFNVSAGTIVLSKPALVSGSAITFVPLPTNVTFRGMNFPGHYAEKASATPLWLNNMVNTRIYDCIFTDQASGCITMQDVSHTRIVDCDIDHVCSGLSGGNAIDLDSGQAELVSPLIDYYVAGNTITRCASEAIGIVAQSSGGRSLSPHYGRVIGNYVDQLDNVKAHGIWVETGNNSGNPQAQIIIANNEVNCPATESGIHVINDAGTLSTSPYINSYIIVQGNICTAATGITVAGSYISVLGNICNGTISGINATDGGGTTTVTGTSTNGSAVVTAISGAGGLLRGYGVAAAGLVSGTYVGRTAAYGALATPLSTGGAITALPVTALIEALPDGSGVTLRSGASTQNWTVSNSGSPVAVGATSIPVVSQTPNLAYPAGTGITSPAWITSGATWTLSAPATASGAISMTMTTPGYGVRVANNIVHMVADFTGNGIKLGSLIYSSVNNNGVHVEPGSTGSTTTNDGIEVAFCGWTSAKHNDVEYAPANGINCTNGHDLRLHGNEILNANENGIAAKSGLNFSNCTGTANRIISNSAIDDRVIPQMINAIAFNTTGSGVNQNFIVRGNDLLGSTSTPANTLTGVIVWRDNKTDQPGWLAGASIGSMVLGTPFTNTQPYPVMVYFAGGTSVAAAHIRAGASITTVGNFGGTTGLGSIMLMPGDQLEFTGTTIPSSIKQIPVLY